jgi:hypothetical protein
MESRLTISATVAKRSMIPHGNKNTKIKTQIEAVVGSNEAIPFKVSEEEWNDLDNWTNYVYNIFWNSDWSKFTPSDWAQFDKRGIKILLILQILYNLFLTYFKILIRL